MINNIEYLGVTYQFCYTDLLYNFFWWLYKMLLVEQTFTGGNYDSRNKDNDLMPNMILF